MYNCNLMKSDSSFYYVSMCSDNLNQILEKVCALIYLTTLFCGRECQCSMPIFLVEELCYFIDICVSNTL